MSTTVISVEEVCKAYRLGMISGRTLKQDWAAWWARARRKPNPNLKIGQEHLELRRGENFWALKDVSFEIKQGEALGIIGRNGSGKSTLLKILSQVTAPTSGEIKIKGRVASLLEIGTGFHPELSGRENVYLNGAILGMTRAEIARKLDEIVGFSGVEQFIDTPVKRYSSGMYVRLAFAVAAHLEAEVLVVDEVLAVGDMEFQEQCLSKMNASAREGRTVIFVSHTMASIERLCSKAVLLKAGKVAAHGDASEIVKLYSRSSSMQPAEIDLSRLQRSNGHLFRAKLSSAKLISSSKAGDWAVPFGERLAISISIDVSQSVDNLEFGIGVFNAAGHEIVSSLSRHSGVVFDLNPGSHEVSADFGGLRLAPGRYRIGLGLHSKFGFEDYIAHAIDFEVLPNSLARTYRTETLEGPIIPNVSYATARETPELSSSLQ